MIKLSIIINCINTHYYDLLTSINNQLGIDFNEIEILCINCNQKFDTNYYANLKNVYFYTDDNINVQGQFKLSLTTNDMLYSCVSLFDILILANLNPTFDIYTYGLINYSGNVMIPVLATSTVINNSVLYRTIQKNNSAVYISSEILLLHKNKEEENV